MLTTYHAYAIKNKSLKSLIRMTIKLSETITHYYYKKLKYGNLSLYIHDRVRFV